MLDAPIFIIKWLEALYLLPEPDSEPEREPSNDFLLQEFLRASTLPERRRGTSRAVTEDDKRENARILQMCEGQRGRSLC
jgi:hypothetical protein